MPDVPSKRPSPPPTATGSSKDLPAQLERAELNASASQPGSDDETLPSDTHLGGNGGGRSRSGDTPSGENDTGYIGNEESGGEHEGSDPVIGLSWQDDEENDRVGDDASRENEHQLSTSDESTGDESTGKESKSGDGEYGVGGEPLPQAATMGDVGASLRAPPNADLRSEQQVLSSPGPSAEALSHRSRRTHVLLSLSLFCLTFLSAMWSELIRMGMAPRDLLWVPLREPQVLLLGLPFALTLMAILLAHEMGHFLTARYYKVDQSPPFFIPAPTIFGTFGAVILMRTLPKNRRVLLHVAAAGPYAGLLVALPAAAWGLAHSAPIEPAEWVGRNGWGYGSSLLFHWLQQGFGPEAENVVLHPVALAGWVGMFITSLNLIPAAQLDGGHIAYALLGKEQERVSLAVVVLLLCFGLGSFLLGEPGSSQASGTEVWIFWALLLFVVGIGHPPVRDPTLPLSRADRLAGVVALAVFVLTFVPRPVTVFGMDARSPDPGAGPPHHAPRDGGWAPGKGGNGEANGLDELRELQEATPHGPEEFRL